MPKKTQPRVGKKVAKTAAPYAKKKTGKQAKPASKKVTKNEQAKSVLFEKKPRNFGIGNDIQPKRDLTRFVKWPKYIRLQRQKRVLLQRLKVPPSINQFSRTLDKATAKQLFHLMDKYKPETRSEKKRTSCYKSKRNCFS